MSIRIGHASLGSNGKISGDIAGDQNNKEVCIRQWYNKPWGLVLRPLDLSIAEKSAQACEAGCNNNNIGYNQLQRNTAHTEAKKVGYDLSKISVPCETDCSAFMTLCAIAAGITELEYTGNAPTTSTMGNVFVKTGKYEKLTDSKYLTSDKYLKRGDILVKPGSHTVMALENGNEVSANISKKVENTKANTNSLYSFRAVDVSEYQKNINYLDFKTSGVQNAIIKIINKSLKKEPMFDTHWDGFSNVGVPCDVYAYSYANTVERARLEAQTVLKVLNGRKCTIYMDVEDKVQMGLGNRITQIINAFQNDVEANGYKFAIYSGLSFVKTYLKPYVNQLNCKDIWFARYYKGYETMYINSNLDNTKKPLVDGFNTIGWQYTSSGKIPTYNGRLDMSILYTSIPSQEIKGQKGVVTANSLFVRDKGSTLGKPIGTLKKGDIVTILGIDPISGWYQIAQDSFVSNKYINLL